MQEIISEISHWLEEEESIAIATGIETWGSAPRGVGAKMALTASGKIAGSVSGGCVEGAVINAGIEVLRTRQAQLLCFGVEDETAWRVGLACGGTIEIFVQPLREVILHALLEATGRPNATVTIVRGPSELLGRQLLFVKNERGAGGLGEGLDEPATDAAREALQEGRSCRMEFSCSDQDTASMEVARQRPAALQPHALGVRQGEKAEIFIEVTLPPPTLISVGGVHTSIALTKIAHMLGYRTVVVDPRRAFGNAERFPHVGNLLHAWPDKALDQVGLNSSTAVAVLTHDPKLDDPALQVALPSPAFYVGALGSRATTVKRHKRLVQSGLAAEHLDRLHAPIGMHIGSSTPEEIALAVMAQIVAVRHGLQGARR